MADMLFGMLRTPFPGKCAETALLGAKDFGNFVLKVNSTRYREFFTHGQC